MHVPLHFAERALALHLLLKRLEGLVDVVVADENLNQGYLSCGSLTAHLIPAKGGERTKNLGPEVLPFGFKGRDISEGVGGVHGADDTVG
jgi:hypothetical protein